MKKIISVILALVFLSAFSFVCYADSQTRAQSIDMRLDFDGTTAKCSANVYDYGKYITATIYLREGSTLVGSWASSDYSAVCLSGEVSVQSGHTYTLSLSGTSNSTLLSVPPITRVCP